MEEYNQTSQLLLLIKHSQQPPSDLHTCLPPRVRAVTSAAQPAEIHAAILKIQSSSSSEGRFQGKGTDYAVKKVKTSV